jgi:hypothetical protein
VTAAFVESLKELSSCDQRFAIAWLLLNCAIDGRMSSGDRHLLVEACKTVGIRPSFSLATRIMGDFIHGRELQLERLLAQFGGAGES